MRAFSVLLPLLLCGALISACREIDCPLDNEVVLTATLYSSEEGGAYTMEDTLTVLGAGTDSILYNAATGISSLTVPIHQTAEEDTLLFRFSDASGQEAADTVFLPHTNASYFESLDCPPSVFHTLTGARWTSHALSAFPLTIDSVALIRPLVDYDDVENIRIFLRSTASE